MIQESFMRELYRTCAGRYGRQPNPEEFKAWMDVLSSYYFSDVDSAIRRWSGNTAVDMGTGRMAGARMPSPAELKASIQSFDKSHSDRFQPCDQCEEGWVRVTTGKTAGGTVIGNSGAVRRCECWWKWLEWKKGSTQRCAPELVASGRAHGQVGGEAGSVSSETPAGHTGASQVPAGRGSESQADTPLGNNAANEPGCLVATSQEDD